LAKLLKRRRRTAVIHQPRPSAEQHGTGWTLAAENRRVYRPREVEEPRLTSAGQR
jgi:hypothetical protein